MAIPIRWTFATGEDMVEQFVTEVINESDNIQRRADRRLAVLSSIIFAASRQKDLTAA